MMEVGGMCFADGEGEEQHVGLCNVGAGDCKVGGSVVARGSSESEAWSLHAIGENVEENRL